MGSVLSSQDSLVLSICLHASFHLRIYLPLKTVLKCSHTIFYSDEEFIIQVQKEYKMPVMI